MGWNLLLRNVAGLTALFCSASTMAAQADTTPQVIASGQGVAVAVSNWTEFVMQQPTEASSTQDAGLAGPGFPFALWPLQHGGTSVVMRGGPASQGEVSASYVIQNDADPNPGFTIGFEADTEWDFAAAASLLLHTAKKTAAKQSKGAAKAATKDTAEAAGAADGVTEVVEVYKVIRLIAKLFGALDPTFVMNIELYPTSGTTFTNNSCVTKYQSTPGPANVQIFGPGEEITASNADSFFVVAAGSSNGISPGFVDVGVNSLCDYVCAAWNGSLELLTNLDQDNCYAAYQGTAPQAADYDEALAQNSCLPDAASGPGGVQWVAPVFDSSVWAFNPATGCTVPQSIEYPVTVTVDGELSNICGVCGPPGFDEPLGSWSESCDEVSFVAGQQELTADCATDASPDRTTRSTLMCDTGHWQNYNGQLECENLPGSWAGTCELFSYTNGTLCATCGPAGTNPLDGVISCATCPSGSWYDFEGQLMCEQNSSQSQVLPPPDRGSLDAFALASDSRATLLAGRTLSLVGVN